ncbi:hypothetical protein PIB30_064445 [Stylosanthes scabra]|uniref:Uncharacterized protein n=1 Tax=Stylosanthes scabra TaxID=79078 RepID=A0ABU6SMJ1_9FABA|nr:hypothetical protein [Stylosanthes scabra]
MGLPRDPGVFHVLCGEIGRGRFLSLTSRLDDPRWMFAPLDLPVSATHPRDELNMLEDPPARGRRNDAGGRGRRPPADAPPPRTPANLRD